MTPARAPVFLDSVGLVALWNQRDQWHDAAVEAYRRLARDYVPLVTTSHVLLECGNAAARWPYRAELIALRRAMEAGECLVHPGTDDWRQGWEAYDRRENAGAGIVDQISIIVMRRQGLVQVFGNDQHFRAAGFETVF